MGYKVREMTILDRFLLNLVSGSRHGWIFHLYIILVQYPIYVTFSTVASPLHDFLYTIAGFIHVDNQLVSFQFSILEAVGIQFSLQVIMRSPISFAENLAYQV